MLASFKKSYSHRPKTDGQQLTRLRSHVTQTLVAEEARVFSAYKHASPFSKLFGKASAAVLSQFSSEELLKMQDAVTVALSLTMQNIEFLKSQIKKLDGVSSRELKAFPQTLTTIPGTGPCASRWHYR